jgi:hypothetical protein
VPPERKPQVHEAVRGRLAQARTPVWGRISAGDQARDAPGLVRLADRMRAGCPALAVPTLLCCVVQLRARSEVAGR